MKNKFLFAAMAMILVLPLSMMAQKEGQKLKKNQTEIIIATNMTCNGCKTEIEKALSYEKGVIEVEGDLATKNVRVVFKTNKNTAENLVACVQKAGYQAKLVSSKCCDENSEENHKCDGENHSGDHKCSGDNTEEKGCCNKKK